MRFLDVDNLMMKAYRRKHNLNCDSHQAALDLRNGRERIEEEPLESEDEMGKLAQAEV